MSMVGRCSKLPQTIKAQDLGQPDVRFATFLGDVRNGAWNEGGKVRISPNGEAGLGIATRAESLDRRMEFAKNLREARTSVVGVQSAGIRKKPNLGLPELFLLGANVGGWSSECDTIGGDSQYREHFWLIAAELATEGASAALKFFLREFIRANSRSSDHVGNAVAQPEKLGIFTWVEDARGESTVVESGPEPVSRTGEVVPRPGCVESRIDATKQDIQVVIDDVRDLPIDGCQEFLATWQFPFFSGFPVMSTQGAGNSI